MRPALFIIIGILTTLGVVFALRQPQKITPPAIQAHATTTPATSAKPVTKPLEPNDTPAAKPTKIVATTTPKTSPQNGTSTLPKSIENKPKPATEATSKPPPVKVTSVTVPTPLPQSANELVRSTVVNILCSAKNQTLASATGSGVIIDPQGIILTNAHLAQYFLLKDYPRPDSIICTIRTGSPAYPRYRAQLLFISPSWIKEHAGDILQQSPTGTGERDYALLRITESIDGSTLPTAFPFLQPLISQETIDTGNPVLAVGYPAGFLGSIAVERDLSLVSTLSTVQEIFTFKDTTRDLISLGGTVLAQKGASGGAIADSSRKLLGIIVTTTLDASTANRDLQAITLPYINRTLKEETGMTIAELLSGNLADKAESFEKTLTASLTTLLTQAIERR